MYDLNKAENEAYQLLLKNGYYLNTQFPANPVRMAENLGIMVSVMSLDEIRGWLPDADNETSGFLYRPGKLIVVRKEDAEVRQRFTVAHEIGHYTLHDDLVTDFVRRSQLSSQGIDPKEMEANRFAAALLMPAFAFVREVNARKSVAEIARVFGVSESAVVNRAAALKATPL